MELLLSRRSAPLEEICKSASGIKCLCGYEERPKLMFGADAIHTSLLQL